MTRRKRLSYALSCAIIITSLAYLFYDAGGEYLLVPGMAVEFYLIYPIDVMISSGNHRLHVPVGNHFTFSVVIYALLLYALLLIFTRARAARADDLPAPLPGRGV